MKQLILMVAILVMITSCRVLKKNKVKADSTVARSETVTGSWDRVTVTEVFVTGNELLAVSGERGVDASVEQKSRYNVTLSGVEGRPGLGFDSAQPDKRHFLANLLRPKRSPKTQSLLSRTTTHERGTYSEHKQEEKQVHVQQKTKEVEGVNGWILPVMGILGLLAVVAIIIYESKKRLF